MLAKLGARSSAHAIDYAELYSLHEANADHPTVRLKRDLWARLLRTAFGTSFEDDAALLELIAIEVPTSLD